jgi:hypothetical protein
MRARQRLRRLRGEEERIEARVSLRGREGGHPARRDVDEHEAAERGVAAVERAAATTATAAAAATTTARR